MSTPTTEPRIDADADARRDALVERLFGATIAAQELFSVYLGTRLGLYAALADGRARTPDELAREAGIHPRYAQEWLEQQSVAGLLDVAEAGADGAAPRFLLPPGAADVLVDPESLSYLAPFGLMMAGIGRILPDLVEAYRTGGGVPYLEFGTDFRDGQAAINRPAYTHDLASWIATMPDVAERLGADPPARVAEVGCGTGWASIALARAFPRVRVDGIDLDEPSVADALANLAGSGVEDRVEFSVRDAADPGLAGTFDLVCIFEALHDLSRPVEALRAVAAMLAPGGSVLVADERVEPAFTAPAGEVERMMYGWSVLHCLPASMADQPSAATGTVIRESTVRRYAEEAGLGRVDVLPVENDFFRLYRLRP